MLVSSLRFLVFGFRLRVCGLTFSDDGDSRTRTAWIACAIGPSELAPSQDARRADNFSSSIAEHLFSCGESNVIVPRWPVSCMPLPASIIGHAHNKKRTWPENAKVGLVAHKMTNGRQMTTDRISKKEKGGQHIKQCIHREKRSKWHKVVNLFV